MDQSYPEGFDRALQLASTALAYMKKKGIPTNPNNFLVWYEYFSGANAKLKQAAQPLVLANAEVSDRDSADLYVQFFGADDRVGDVHGWTSRIEVVVHDVSRALVETGGGTHAYGEALRSFSDDLEVAASVSDIGRMVTQIITETQSMSAAVQVLQSKIADSAEQVSQLTVELERAREDAQSDGVTGLVNRKSFDVRLARAMGAADESGEALSLALADLDHFKSFNDTYGHQVGDQVLRVVGRTLMSLTKGQDTSARYGGEEFAIILPNTSLGGAVTVAENIRRAVAGKRLRRKGSDAPMDPLTLSVGVTTHVPGETPEAFIGRVDRALYDAKRSGRNRVVPVEGDARPAPAAPAARPRPVAQTG